jgi:menaquinone-dependent protoporphyrinogen oxidase
MASILIVYGTAYGQTERIAHEIAGVLRESDHEVRVVKGDQLPAELALTEYDGFVVASSVLLGRHQRYISRFVRDHLAQLNAAPSAFVSVCGVLAEPNPEGTRVAQTYLDQFLGTTGWQPSLTKSFAGGVPYTRYSPWVRWVMKMISRRTGRPTDTSRDHEFTDWKAVAQFAQHFGSLFPAEEGRNAPAVCVVSKDALK